MTTETYTGGYTVVDQRGPQPNYEIIGHYPTLAQAWRVAGRTTGATVLRSEGDRYDIREATTVSMITQKVGVLADGSTFRWPA